MTASGASRSYHALHSAMFALTSLVRSLKWSPILMRRCMSCQPESEMKSPGGGSLHFSSERFPFRKKSSSAVSSVPSPAMMRSVIWSENMSLWISKIERHE